MCTSYQRSTIGIAFCWLSLCISGNKAMATSTFPTGIPRTHPTGENACVIRFIFCVFENASLHPKCSFAIASAAILAFRWLEVPQVFKHQYCGFVLRGPLDNVSTHQMGYMLIHVIDLAPEVCIILFAFCYDTSLSSIACDPSELFLPKAIYPSTTANELGG